MKSLKVWDPKDRLWAYVRAAKEKMAAEEHRRRDEESARQSQSIEQTVQEKIRALAIRYQPFAVYESDAFVADCARTRTAELFARRDEILAAYQELHSDPIFLARLQAQDPHTYARATFEARALAQAERVASQSLPRKRLTKDEVRAKIVWRHQRRADDLTAITETKAQNIIKARTQLKTYADDLDPGELLQLETELIQAIVEEEDPHASRKETL